MSARIVALSAGRYLPVPGRKLYAALPEFVGTNTIKQTPEQRAALINFVSTD